MTEKRSRETTGPAVTAVETNALGEARRLDDALDAITEAFVIYDADGRLVLCNRRFQEIYGYSDEEVRPGVHFQELGRIDIERGNVVVGDEFGDGEDYLARKAEYRRTLKGSFTVRLKDGRWLKTTDRRLPDGGFVSVQSDVTEIKRAEHEMARAKAEAERSNRAKSEFLAKMSHELRTPLNSILGYSEVLAMGDPSQIDPERVQDYARSIHRAGSLLLDLVNDVLDLSKIEADRAEVVDSQIDLSTLVDECIELSLTRPDAAALRIERIGDEAPPTLVADDRFVRQILINLLSNAIKFSHADSRVQVELGRTPEGGCRIAVIDKGVGIAAQDLDRIVEPFEQVAGSFYSGGTGSGLGLAIANSLVELHGGTLVIDSEPGVGTTVTVSFPPDRVV